MNNKAVIYARVSSKEQEQEGYSIPAQLKLLNDYAIKHGFEVVEEFTDNETAKKVGRTNFGNMLKFLKKNKSVNTIIVEKTDRLYRNFKDYTIIDDSKFEIHLVKENSILGANSKSNEKFVHGINVLMAKRYIDNLSEEVKKGQHQKAAQGEYPGKPPYGYYRLNHKKILVNQDEAKYVKRAFELYSGQNLSLTIVIDRLYEEGFIYKSNKPKIGKSNLDVMMKNVFYIGQFKFKERIYEGIHEPIIDKQVFYKVQKAFKKDNKPEISTQRNFAFTGMIKCAECGSAITAEIKKGKYIYYHCTGWHKNCSMKKKSINENEIVNQLEKAIKVVSMDAQQANWLKADIKEFFGKEQEYHHSELGRLNKKIDLLKSRIDKMYIDYLDGLVSREFYQNKSEEWNFELDKSRNLIQAHDKANNSFQKRGLQIVELLENLYSSFITLNNFEKAEMARIILSNFLLEGSNLLYDYKKPFSFFAKGLNCSIDLGRKDSNLWMPGPKPGALPLGDAPIRRL